MNPQEDRSKQFLLPSSLNPSQERTLSYCKVRLCSSPRIHSGSGEQLVQQHPLKVEDNFYNNFPKAAVDLETSKNSNTGGIWLTNDSRSTEVEEERRSGVGEKRKNLFIETNQQKKHERETNHADLTDKAKVSHISITTDEGSTAENEDVADSEVDGSTSRHISQHDDVSKRFVSSGSLSRSQKESHAFGDSSGAEILGQKRFTISSEKDLNVMSMPMHYGVSFPGQAVNMNKRRANTELLTYASYDRIPTTSLLLIAEHALTNAS
ncbi:UNVERIFIED_CONTAM: Ninja-family protein [Sesamum calycinum]|uniref:Ninja-family protein n=1 Tax=Sesamum calycinum TaxID=2727403 RepID=A0AAW2IS88_9LAMI